MKILVAAAAVAAASLALRAAVPINAVANAVHDDALFVRLAESIAAGEWLGSYDNLTHAKGAAYPAFIALAGVVALPLKIAEHVAYLSGCAALSWVVSALVRSRAAGLVCFSLLALNPLVWSAAAGGRMVREGLYATLALWIVALAAHALLAREEAPAGRGRRVTLVALGVVGALFWLTREEGLWLAPSVAVLAIAVMARQRWRTWLRGFAIPTASFVAVVGAVNGINYAWYGEFRNNDFRSRDFQQAYGALSRISHEVPRPYVLFPADARRKAYAASPAARELAPVLEGPQGDNYRMLGCAQTRTDPCPEILAGWFMWALRDAVAAAGHYESATKARAFYRTLAREVNAACDRGVLACGPRSDSLVPPWRPEYGPRVASESWRVFTQLANLAYVEVAIVPAVGTAREIERFAMVTGDFIAVAGEMPQGLTRRALAREIARGQVALAPWLLAAAFAATLVAIAIAYRRRRWHPGLALVAALWAAVATRVGLLGFLAATSIPANDALYLSPVVPLSLALAPVALFLLIDMRREGAR